MAMIFEGQEPAKQHAQLVARAWRDEAFHQRLLADPRTVLEEYGIAAPAGREHLRSGADSDYSIGPKSGFHLWARCFGP